MTKALPFVLALVLGSCEVARPLLVAPVIEVTGPVAVEKPVTWRPGPVATAQGDGADYTTDLPIAMP